MNRTKVATTALALPAAMALGLSADTSWRFLDTVLKISQWEERALLCGTAEASVIALSVYAWATGSKIAAYLAYAVVLVQAVPAFAVSDGSGGVFRALFGPALLLVLLHLLLGLEVRMSGSRPDSLLSRAVREARERLVAYLGLGRRGENSAAIARSRAADRAVRLSAALAAAKEGSRRHRKLTARLAKALDDAQHGLDAETAEVTRRTVTARVVQWKSVGALAHIGARHEWVVQLDEPILSAPEPDLSLTEIDDESEREGEGGDALTNGALLLGHEPPKWSSLAKRAAVEKADEILPNRSAREISEALAQVGVEISPESVRSNRSVNKRKTANA
jgi:hypothetical protein